MAVSNSTRNPRARAALWLGLLAAISVPGGIALPRYTVVTLFQAVYGFPVPILLGVVAIVQARRAREVLERTLSRSGGERAAAWGRALGLFAVCLGITAGLALGFYWVLVASAR
jgi:uncharacterized membrane protein YfcA